MTKPWSTSARRWERHSHRRRPCRRKSQPCPVCKNPGQQVPISPATCPRRGIEREEGNEWEEENEREEEQMRGEEVMVRKQNENEKADAEASLRRDKIINSFYVVNKRGPVLQLRHRPLVSHRHSGDYSALFFSSHSKRRMSGRCFMPKCSNVALNPVPSGEAPITPTMTGWLSCSHALRIIVYSLSSNE